MHHLYPLASSATESYDLGSGLLTVALGMLVVFSVLILLIFVLEGVGRVMATFDSKPDAPIASPPPQPVAAVAPPVVPDTPAFDGHLIAVITAAIAAHTSQAASTFRVSSIRRIVNSEGGWAAEARRDVIDSRKG